MIHQSNKNDSPDDDRKNIGLLSDLSLNNSLTKLAAGLSVGRSTRLPKMFKEYSSSSTSAPKEIPRESLSPKERPRRVFLMECPKEYPLVT